VVGLVPSDSPVADASSPTFYTAMSNMDFEIGQGNAGAIAVREHGAQHNFLTHMDFHLGPGLAGVYQVGNESEDLHFYGGQFGIIAEKTSPAWQFTLIDSTFEGQSVAAIREKEARLTLVNVSFANTPIGIDIPKGWSDSLWGKDVRFDNVSDAAVVISSENNVFTQIGFENALASRTPVFARFRDSGKTVKAPGATYQVANFNYGLTLPSLGATGHYATAFNAKVLASLPAAGAPAIRALPPMSQWVSVRTLGVKGDNVTNDTAALQKAIDEHAVLYFPAGRYVINDTLKLKPDTVLIGLHPDMTQIVLPTLSPNYAGIGDAKAMIEAPKGGRNQISGLGIQASANNPRATALLWMAGENSLVDDVKIQGGGGTSLSDGSTPATPDITGTTGPNTTNLWGAQYPGIMVTNGGGGTFAAIWTPNTFNQAGFSVSNTSTPGHVYELSNEHHLVSEIKLQNVQNWEFLAPQTEEESAEGKETYSLDIRDSKNILIANYHGYRVTRTLAPVADAVRIYNSTDIRFRNVHVNSESGVAAPCIGTDCTFLRLTKFPFENSIHDMTHGQEVREREFAVLDVKNTPVAKPVDALAKLAPGARVQKIAGGFFSISGATTDPGGLLYFVEHHTNRIYSWSANEKLRIIRDAIDYPVNLAVDRSGNLLVQTSEGTQGTVYSFNPKKPEDPITFIRPTPVADHPGGKSVLPVNFWVNGEFQDLLNPTTHGFPTMEELFVKDLGLARPMEYVSPDGSLALPAYRLILQGANDAQGWRFSHSLDTYGFLTASPGSRITIADSAEDKTYTGLVGKGGAITDLKMFANRGGESVTTDTKGNVFVANGQIYVYDKTGQALGEIDVPERPIQLIFGGADHRTLFIFTHHSLYSVRV
ncbi:MAG: SMP-30/Gluconolaconase/LRE domain protein, partial [Caulobacteraceae bacterium]|nr:SMP-30/Gluconolaconase/LRE domain protein [Caulobacteraceae bacterium]